MSKKIISHYKLVDPVISKLIERFGLPDQLIKRTEQDYFLDLIESIVNQQLSGKVATVIFSRFKGLFKYEITPEEILKLEDIKIREIGISYGKIKYIKDLSDKVVTKQINLNELDKLSDQEVIENLIKVKGIGKWTAEMFLIFTLARDDIFSFGDLGLKNGFKKVYEKDNPSQKEMEEIISKWSPYKSYGARLLWKSLEK